MPLLYLFLADHFMLQMQTPPSPPELIIILIDLEWVLLF